MEDQIIQLVIITAHHLFYFSYRLCLSIREIQELWLLWRLPAYYAAYFFPERPRIAGAYSFPVLEKASHKAHILRESNNDLHVRDHNAQFRYAVVYAHIPAFRGLPAL